MTPRAARFVGVGVVGFIVQLAAIDLLMRLGTPYVAAAAIGVELAILQNFAWHERWTWNDRRARTPRAVAGRLMRFNAAAGAVSIIGNAALTMLFVEVAHAPVLMANTLAVLTLSTVNYAVANRWVFARAAV